MECWNNLGSPKIVNEKTKAAVPLIAGVYEFSCSGAGLHIILDDWNIDDSSIAFCEHYIENERGTRSQEQLDAERACLKAFKEMTLEERASALAMYGDYFKQ